MEVDLVTKTVGRTVAELPDDPELKHLRFHGAPFVSCAVQTNPSIAKQSK